MMVLGLIGNDLEEAKIEKIRTHSLMPLYDLWFLVCAVTVGAALATVTRITSIRAGQNADNNGSSSNNNKSVSMQLMITNRMRDVLINELKCVAVLLIAIAWCRGKC